MAAKPRFTVPPGAVARVRIIDSTTRLLDLPAKTLVTPTVPGFELMPETPTWCFLIESPSGGKALFDLGVPPNWRDKFPPAIVDLINKGGWLTEADRHVADILRDDGISPSSINAIVWSHWHGDHQGDVSTFPSSTDLIVGPGFKEAFLPGYPAKENSPVSESDFVSRRVHEITFPSTPNALQIGRFRAYDFFSDGSFYLLDTPGHAVGHLAGLARTTPDTFVLMGGDICHHNGELRPSKYLPLPAEVRLPAFAHIQGGFCSGAELESIQTERSRAPNQPFFDPNVGVDIPLAIQTLKEVQEPDADDNVLFICAHDYTIKGIVDFFPAEANDWKAKGWREKTYWKFLEDFQGALEGGKS